VDDVVVENGALHSTTKHVGCTPHVGVRVTERKDVQLRQDLVLQFGLELHAPVPDLFALGLVVLTIEHSRGEVQKLGEEFSIPIPVYLGDNADGLRMKLAYEGSILNVEDIAVSHRADGSRSASPFRVDLTKHPSLQCERI
jgi:hypothetical protein